MRPEERDHKNPTRLEFVMKFPHGMPKATSQQKGVTIRYLRNGKPYIQHYTKENVESAATLFKLQLRQHKPQRPLQGPVKLFVILFFNIKEKRFWGKYKDTRPDLDNYIKLLNDQMTKCGYWSDDSQVAELHVKKRYAEEAQIYVRVLEISEEET